MLILKLLFLILFKIFKYLISCVSIEANLVHGLTLSDKRRSTGWASICRCWWYRCGCLGDFSRYCDRGGLLIRCCRQRRRNWRTTRQRRLLTNATQRFIDKHLPSDANLIKCKIFSKWITNGWRNFFYITSNRSFYLNRIISLEAETELRITNSEWERSIPLWTVVWRYKQYKN